MRLSASIAHRLGAVLGGLILLIVAMVVLAWSQMAAMQHQEQQITDNWLPSVELVNQLNTNTRASRASDATTDAKLESRDTRSPNCLNSANCSEVKAPSTLCWSAESPARYPFSALAVARAPATGVETPR